MRKIIFAFLLCLPAIFVSCDDNNPNDERFGASIESGWVEFAYDSSSTITGAADQIMIPVRLKTVELNTPVNKNGFDVTYEVTGVNGAPVNSLSYSGTVRIPAGELVGNIVIDLPQSSNGCLNYTVKLLSVNKNDVTVGLDETSVISHNLQIGNTRDSFIGTYQAIEDNASSYNVTVTAGSAPNELIISNLYNVSTTSKTHIFLNPGDKDDNISYPEFNDNLLLSSTNPAQGDVFVSNDFVSYLKKANDSPADFVPSFYNACNQDITLNFFLILGEDQQSTIPAEVTPSGPKSIKVVMTKI